MSLVKQRVIAEVWPEGKNKVGDEYRSLNIQIDGIIRSISNSKSDATWLPLDWMGVDKVVELVKFLYNRPTDRMLLDRLIRKRKRPDYTNFRMLNKEKKANNETELIYKSDEASCHKDGTQKVSLREIERVNILNRQVLMDEIIQTRYKERDYEMMIIDLMNINTTIYMELIEEYQLLSVMGLRIMNPNYIDQYLCVVYKTICRLLIKFMLTKKPETEIEKRIANLTTKIATIKDRIEKEIVMEFENPCDVPIEDIMLRFTQYLYGNSFLDKLKEILHLEERPPTYITNIADCHNAANIQQKRNTIEMLIHAALENDNNVLFDTELSEDDIEDTLLLETYADKGKYDRKTARTIVQNLLRQPDGEGDNAVYIDCYYLKYLDIKYLRGALYKLGVEGTYKAFCELINKMTEILLLPYRLFDDTKLYCVIYDMFQELLGGILSLLLCP